MLLIPTFRINLLTHSMSLIQNDVSHSHHPARIPHVSVPLARDAATTSRRYSTSSTGCQSESVLSSKWHAWFASRCPGRHLSTWHMIAASCLTVLDAVCGQLTSRLAWYQEHTAAMATELLQPLDLVSGTLYRSNCAIQPSPTDCFDDS